MDLISRLDSRSTSGLPNWTRARVLASAGESPSLVSSSARASRWNRISSSRSRSRRLRRATLARRESQDTGASLCVLQGPEHGRIHGEPAFLLQLEPPATVRRDLVRASAAVVLGDRPLRLDPARFFHAVERRIERSLFDAQLVAGDLLDAHGDGVTVQRAPSGEELQYEQ